LIASFGSFISVIATFLFFYILNTMLTAHRRNRIQNGWS
jgi:hypothetical protein